MNELTLNRGSQSGVPAISGALAVEQSRAIAETQAAMVVAMSRPRDEEIAFTKIMKACDRQSLASTAMYAYPRGGQMVEGPSIRLAEVMARAWGNITYGMRELSRESGTSEIEAFAWDLESNTRVTRQFVLKHIRDKKGGGQQLKDERDIYELAANMGQRRVRACLLELIPGDIVEEATNRCKKTLSGGDGKPMEDRVRAMLVAFDQVGVTKAMVEAFLSHSVKAIVPVQLVKLQQIYKSINDGIASREEFFNLNAGESSINDKFSGSAKPPETKTEAKKENPEPGKVTEQQTALSTTSKIIGDEKIATDSKVPGPSLQIALRKNRTAMSLDKWRSNNYQSIGNQLGEEGRDLFIEWAQVVYEMWKQEEAENSQLTMEV